MNEATLPPSPNWYLSTILSCAEDGSVAWGARNVIVISKWDADKSVRNYSIIRNAHKEKVTSVSFESKCVAGNHKSLASTGDDAIKIWNITTLALSHIHVPEHGNHAITVEWCPHEAQVLYALTSDGCLLMWNLRFDTISTFSLGKISATCLSCCPHQKNLLAVGTKNGLVNIVNFGNKGSVIYKLRGHDTEVVGLSWCPSEENVISKNGQKDLLLASGGRDRNIFIWRAGGDGRYETQITISSNPFGVGQHRSKLNAATGDWITVNWIEPNLLVSSSTWGELICWDLSRQMKGKPFCRLIHSNHLRGLFCIAKCPTVHSNADESAESKNSLTLWTVAQDRQIIGCKMSESNVDISYSIPTQGGYVYCIAPCPFDTTRLAFGVGDAMLRIWNLSEAHSTSFNVTTLWQKIKGKIRVVSWHPEKENLLAYATDEGRVGVFDVNSNKPPLLYRQYHRDTVYALGWGPCSAFKQPVLYSCAEGQLVYYDPDQLKRGLLSTARSPISAVELSNRAHFDSPEAITVVKKDCSEFAWKPDLSCLAVGLEDGSISFLSRDFKVLGATKQQSGKNVVHCLAWHPDSTAADIGLSPLRNSLAVAYNSSSITVFDLSNFVNHMNDTGAKDTNGTALPSTFYNVHEVLATLNGHTDKVVCLAWSPHLTGHLVSGSYDNTAQVWNVETQELLATYTGHSGPVLCVSWSPLHPDFILTGSADFTLRIWHTEELVPVVPTKPAKKLNKKKYKKKAETKVNGGAEITKDGAALVASFADLTIEQNASTVGTKASKKKKVERISYFSKTAKLLNDTDAALSSLVKIAMHPPQITNCDNEMREEESGNDRTTLPLFENHATFLSYIKDEKENHLTEGRHMVATEMSVWYDNLKEELDEAAKEKRLTDFLVSLAPSLSTKIWKEMCEAYANQLITEGNPQKAVTYLLCIHKPYEAISVLEDAKLYNEAYAVARCRLDPDDPIINRVLEKCADYYIALGRFEHAAHIYGKLNDFEKAIKYLARRKNPKILAIAADIAMLHQKSDSALALADQSINAAFLESQYEVARGVITKFPQLKFREVHLKCLEEVKKVIGIKADLNTIQSWIGGNSEYSILSILRVRIGTADDDCYSNLYQNSVAESQENEETLCVAVAREIAMAMLCDGPEKRSKHIVGALGLISQYEMVHRKDFEKRPSPLIALIVHLDAASPVSSESIFAQTDFPVSRSLRAYLCYALIHWLVDKRNATQDEGEGLTEYLANVINMILKLNLLEDLFNPVAINHWASQGEIPKLETKLASALAQTGDNNGEETNVLKEELNKLRTKRKEFIDEYVSVPNPVMGYSTALQLDSSVPNAQTHSEKVTELWNKATTAVLQSNNKL